jgi:hypothetical protein
MFWKDYRLFAMCSDYRCTWQDGIDVRYYDHGAQPEGRKYHAICPSKLESDDSDQQGYLAHPSLRYGLGSVAFWNHACQGRTRLRASAMARPALPCPSDRHRRDDTPPPLDQA